MTNGCVLNVACLPFRAGPAPAPGGYWNLVILRSVSMNFPLRFEPHLRPLVWGGRRLGEVLGKPLPTDAAYGEAWEISDHASHHSVVIGGPRRGHTLRRLMEE